MDNPNCGRCGHLNHRGLCNMTACLYPCKKTGMGGYINKPKTNFDEVKNMNVEELAMFILDIMWGLCPKPTSECRLSAPIDCKFCWIAWLKQAAEDGER